MTDYVPEKDIKNTHKHTSNNILQIGSVKVAIGESMADVFDNSPYYVDYGSVISPKGVLLCTCLVGERAYSEHVTADTGFEDTEENVLRQRAIAGGTPLNESMKTGVE